MEFLPFFVSFSHKGTIISLFARFLRIGGSCPSTPPPLVRKPLFNPLIRCKLNHELRTCHEMVLGAESLTGVFRPKGPVGEQWTEPRALVGEL